MTKCGCRRNPHKKVDNVRMTGGSFGKFRKEVKILAAYVSVPRDLTRVKAKVLFNLTRRQVLCFSVAVLLGVPSFFLLRRTGNVSLAALGMILVMLPFFFLAMYEKDGQPFEKIVKHFIEAEFLRPKVRCYQTENYYEVLMCQRDVYREVDAVVFHAEKMVDKGERHREKSEKTGE